MRYTELSADFDIVQPFQPQPFRSLKGRNSWKTWILALFLTLLFHVFIFFIHWEQFFPSSHFTPRTPVQMVNPDKLEAIRKQWKDHPLLIHPKGPTAKEAPADARYSADRNIRVEKEQKAKNTQVLPQPGLPQTQNQPQKAQPKLKQAEPNRHPRRHLRPLPKIGSLGLPFHLEKPTPRTLARDSSEEQESQPQGQEGGDQALTDRNLPTGSENLLNAQETIYYSFYARLYQAIAPIWQQKVREVPYTRRLASGEYSTVVDVVLDSDGNLIEIHRIQGSGIPELDRAVDDSWHRINHFPNPPEGLLDNHHQVHIGWAFTVDVQEGIGVQSLPPRRTY